MGNSTADIVKRELEQLRTRWPQAHAVPSGKSKYSAQLVVLPGFRLPRAFKQDICTVLFVAPDCFPAARPKNFYTDIDVEVNLPVSGFSVRPDPDCFLASVISVRSLRAT